MASLLYTWVPGGGRDHATVTCVLSYPVKEGGPKSAKAQREVQDRMRSDAVHE